MFSLLILLPFSAPVHNNLLKYEYSCTRTKHKHYVFMWYRMTSDSKKDRSVPLKLFTDSKANSMK
jgi:hypothetical protein